MIKIAGTMTDAWSVFFKEAFTPKTRALRKDIFAIFWSPIIIYFLIKYLTISVHKMKFFVTSKTNVNVMDATQSFDQLLSKLTPITSAIWSWISIIIAVYLLCCISSLIIRRMFDMGLSIKTSKIIMFFIIAVIIYTLYPMIVILLNHSQTLFHITITTLPYTSSTYTISFIIILYVLLQVVPSNMFNPKYYTNSGS